MSKDKRLSHFLESRQDDIYINIRCKDIDKLIGWGMGLYQVFLKETNPEQICPTRVNLKVTDLIEMFVRNFDHEKHWGHLKRHQEEWQEECPRSPKS